MDTRNAILNYQYSEKMKSGLIIGTGLLEQVVSLKGGGAERRVENLDRISGGASERSEDCDECDRGRNLSPIGREGDGVGRLGSDVPI